MAGRPFAVFDIDGTLIRWQLYHAVADQLAQQGHLDSAAYEGILEARRLWKQRTSDESFKTYEHSLVKAYTGLLSQLTVSQFDKAAEAVFAEYKDQVYTYTRDLIKTLKAKNYLLFAISNSQQEIVAKVAAYYGFDDYVGTVYKKKNGRFVGTKNMQTTSKHLTLNKLISKHGATLMGSFAVGDSESDISMLEMAEQPIAFNPTKKLLETAKTHSWKVVIERKNVVYELEPGNGRYLLA